ncbi:MAG TPA: sensor histidine kinase [Trebonia sp.]
MSLLYAFAPVYVLFYGQFVPAAVAVFSVARYGRGRVPFYGAATGVLVVSVLTAAVPAERSADSVVFNVVFLILAWLGGWGLARYERRTAAARQRAIDTEVAAATLALAAVADERTRIARELHDIVAHAVSVIVVQAGAAEPVVTENPEYVRAALGAIRTTGADALAEMRRVVAMLREAGDDPQPLSPQPGVAGISDLIEHARRAGLEASLTVHGDPSALPAGLGLAVYRIVQEALSNVRRHAAATRAWVALTYAPDCLHLEVRDDGVGYAGTAGGGHGLIGMRERAALYGGQLETSTGTGPGFTVRVTLPLAAS